MNEKIFSEKDSALLPFVLTTLNYQAHNNPQFTKALSNKADAVLQFVKALLCYLSGNPTRNTTPELKNSHCDALIKSGMIVYDYLGAEQFTSLVRAIENKEQTLNTSLHSQKSDKHKPSTTSDRTISLTIGPQGSWVIINNKYH